MAAAVVALACAACAACASRGGVDPALEAALLERASAAPAAPFREKSRVRITTDVLRGDFDAVLVVAPGASPRARLQLFPEVGGKILDLAATPRRITGVMPQAGRRIDVALGADSGDAATAPRDLLFFMGVTLLELFAPLPPGRVADATAEGGHVALTLAPVVPDVDVVAIVGADGRVIERSFAFRGARWTAREEGRLEISGDDFAMSVERGPQEPLDVAAVQDALFTIPLPGRARP